MPDSGFVQQDFRRRLRNIPPLGMGLSVDVYSPNLFELVNRLKEQGFQPGYLEIFKATTTALSTVRQALPDISLAYHGEGHTAWAQSNVPTLLDLGRTRETLLSHDCGEP